MKTLTSMVVFCAAMLGVLAPSAVAQSQPPAAEQLRPPTPGKQDADSPAALSMLIGAVVVGVVLTANLIASKRSHQD